tara:strand:- start:2279 stop:3562 length:1284 start_codon:yes stop_codon:yes gene_type:complete
MNNLKISKSKKHYEQAKKIIPLASQTFSKSCKLFDKEFFPLFAKRGHKQIIEDIDGNKFIDLINGLGAVSLGYSLKNFNKSLIKSLNNGITFSLAHKIEHSVSKELIKIIPSAEMVRFGKNGTDANSAAIRLARYYTKRDHIAICGYHGWQDWYITSTNMNGGIPKETKKFTHVIEFNNVESVKKVFKKYNLAAVMLEPIAAYLPDQKFLKTLKKLCKKNRTVLIFDEICTGFRVSLGGAQKILKVKPNLSTFGKAMGNGFPISALVGERKIMKNFDKVFYSGTFGGETLSLEACKQTIQFLKKNNSIKKNISKGTYLIKNFNKLSKKYDLQNNIFLNGHPSWPFLIIKNFSAKRQREIKTYFMQEYALNKILFFGGYNINVSHTFKDLKKIIKISEKILSNLYNSSCKTKNILIAKPATPILKIRN